MRSPPPPPARRWSARLNARWRPASPAPSRRRGWTCSARSPSALDATPALAVEDWLRDGLAAGRARDAAAGGAALGAHRADMALAHAAERHAGRRCARTGEQKALLVARGARPCRADRRGARLRADAAAGRSRRCISTRSGATALFAALARLPAQALPDRHGCRDLSARCAGAPRRLRARAGELLPDGAFPASSRPTPLCPERL